MDDDFLYRCRPDVRPEFAESLYKTLASTQPGILEPARTRHGSRFLLFAIALALFGAALVTAIPTVRAQTIEFIKHIGDMTFVLVDLNRLPTPPPVPTLAEGETPVGPEPTINVERALELFPIKLTLPTWIPAGYVLSDQVFFEHNKYRDSATFTWNNPRLVTPTAWNFPISLYVGYPGPGVGEEVPRNLLQETTVNGIPAAIVRGGMNGMTGKYDIPIIRLMWIDHDATYEMTAPDSTSPEDLIRMAESMY